MVSILVTSKKEPESLRLSIKSIIPQIKVEDELIVISPDKGTKDVLSRFNKKNIKLIKDKGVGKPSALNLGISEAKGDILVLTDGDVYIGSSSLKDLIKPFEDSSIGAVCGHPVSVEKRDYMLGYWSHLLTDIAHKIRLNCKNTDKFIECSGYLYAFRAGTVKNIPKDSLAEDAVVSHIIANKGYKITYSPDSYVFVKYPKNYSDWLKQKIRSAGGYTQSYVKNSRYKMRSFTSEILEGFKLAFKYSQNIKETAWTVILFLARIHLWFLILIKIKILHSPFSSVWVRVDSTK